jgi:hypothetical protein
MSEHDEQELIAEFRKNSAEKVRVTLSRFLGKTFVDFRAYFQDDDGTFRPTKKGIAISPDSWDNFRSAVQAAERELEKRGLWALAGREA